MTPNNEKQNAKQQPFDGEGTYGAAHVKMIKHVFQGIKINGGWATLCGNNRILHPQYYKYCPEGRENEHLTVQEMHYIKKQEIRKYPPTPDECFKQEGGE